MIKNYHDLVFMVHVVGKAFVLKIYSSVGEVELTLMFLIIIASKETFVESFVQTPV